jgi:hypothetical protein
MPGTRVLFGPGHQELNQELSHTFSGKHFILEFSNTAVSARQKFCKSGTRIGKGHIYFQSSARTTLDLELDGTRNILRFIGKKTGICMIRFEAIPVACFGSRHS